MELEALAPRVREAFGRVAEPSPRVLRAIHDEAVAHLTSRARQRRFIPLFRTLAAAAALTLLLGGAIQTHLAWREGTHTRAVGHLLNLGASNVPAATAESASELASRLLDIQGLNEDAFFMSEEAEVLWL
jgi:hypothetical protein